MEFPVKVKMFQTLARLCCKCETKCADLVECQDFDTVIFRGLVEVNLPGALVWMCVENNSIVRIHRALYRNVFISLCLTGNFSRRFIRS